MCNAAIARIILFIFNFVFWLAGGAVLGIGIWMKVDEKIVNFLNVVNIDQSDPLVDHAAWLFIVVGAFVFVVGFLGCCGAMRGSQGMLFLYALLVLIVMIVEIAGAILALIYRQKVESHLQDSMVRQIREKYENDNGVGEAWDFLQVKLKCCGATNYTDYQNSAWWNTTRVNHTNVYVPMSCCALKNEDPKNPEPEDLALCQKDVSNNKHTKYVNFEGCHEKLHGWFKTHTLVLVIIGFVIGAIQVIGFVTACCLRSALKKDKGYVN